MSKNKEVVVMKKDVFVFKYVPSDDNREIVIWGEDEKVNALARKKNITVDDISGNVYVVIREKGSFAKDYNEVLTDMHTEHRFYRMFKKYLSEYYIPLSKDGRTDGSNMDVPFEFLQVLIESDNVIYSYIGCKIDYYIKIHKEIPIDILIGFFFYDGSNSIFEFDYYVKNIRPDETLEEYTQRLASENLDRILRYGNDEENCDRLERLTNMLDEIYQMEAEVKIMISEVMRGN